MANNNQQDNVIYHVEVEIFKSVDTESENLNILLAGEQAKDLYFIIQNKRTKMRSQDITNFLDKME
jgi:hypothetical protein